MSRRSSFFSAVVAALLLALVLAASVLAAVPRCDEDGTRVEAAASPAVLRGSLTYNGAHGCADGGEASIDIVNRTGPLSTMAAMNDWTFMVALRSDEAVVYTLRARCNQAVVCEANVSYAVAAN